MPLETRRPDPAVPATRVHVIDDDEAARNSLAFLFDAAGLDVVAHENADDFLAQPSDPGAGCLVTDVRMPGMSGLDLLAELRRRGDRLPVVLITGHGDVPMAVEAMKLGASDFVEKPFDDEAMLRIVRGALARGADVAAASIEQAEIAARLAALSPRERQVLDGLVAGHANKRIAFDLDISPRTVEIYRANVMAKMQAASLSDLVRMALIVERAG
ncbi:response regulator FixJ [Methylobrevis albus]|uniref:Response regulator n=1 Tax=Methylobrevis albus TaxID=2793297 RepID=A0A931I1V4_9HYPH|nr:response regulator FixJ [Methylobrevis albus]MBH0237738.1 response regulator [Methylobrevis albus]